MFKHQSINRVCSPYKQTLQKETLCQKPGKALDETEHPHWTNTLTKLVQEQKFWNLIQGDLGKHTNIPVGRTRLNASRRTKTKAAAAARLSTPTTSPPQGTWSHAPELEPEGQVSSWQSACLSIHLAPTWVPGFNTRFQLPANTAPGEPMGMLQPTELLLLPHMGQLDRTTCCQLHTGTRGHWRKELANGSHLLTSLLLKYIHV